MKQKRILHIICQAHLDPVWIWPRRDGYSEALTTIGSAVEFLEREEDMCFTRSSSAVYRWIRESDPDLFTRIQRLVASGRWEVVNGWEVQPDCNLALGESYVRQSLLGKAWFRSELGVDVNVGYNVDSFGHSGNLPQILLKSGMPNYVCMRPFRQLNGTPYASLFWWESPDGSRILCWRIPRAYGQSPATTPDELEAQIREEAKGSFVEGIKHAPFFLGVGNHGGGPTRRLVERIRKLQTDHTLPKIQFSTLGCFFAAVRRSVGANNLPVLRKGLQYVDVGCYAAHGRIKRASRRAERLLLKAESIQSMESLLGIKRGPGRPASLNSAWQSLLFGHFHDILAGTCVESADTEIANLFGHAEYKAERVCESGLHRMARAMDTRWGEKGMLVLFNPLPWQRDAEVAFDTFVAPTAEGEIHSLRDSHGRLIPIQWGPSETCFGPMGMKWRKLRTVVNLPAFGYRTFALSEAVVKTSGRAFPAILINRRQAGLSRIGANREENLLSAGMRLEVFEDRGDTWGHKLSAYKRSIGRPRLMACAQLEDGPVVKLNRQVLNWKRSSIKVHIIERSGIPYTELSFRINWQEPRQLLRLIIPTRFEDTDVVCSEPGGQTTRAADGNEKPATEWIAVRGKCGTRNRCLGVVADRSMSFCANRGELGIVLARSSFYAHHHPQEVDDPEENAYLDMGILEYRVRIVSGSSLSRLRLHRIAWEMETPAERVMEHSHAGHLPSEGSLLEVFPSTVAVMAIKPAESGTGILLRLQETTGKPTSVRIHVGNGKLISWEGILGRYEIGTFLIVSQGAKKGIWKTGLLEETAI